MRPGVIAALAAGGVLIVGGAGAATYALLTRRPAPLTAGESVLLLGDSLGVGFSQHLADALAPSGVVLDAEPHVGWTAKRVRSAYEADSSLVGTAVVFSLGSNDAAMLDPLLERDDVASLVATARARGARRIVLVVPPNFALASPPSPATTQKQHDFLSLWTDDVELVLPSDAVVAQLAGDRVHLPPSGYQALGGEVAAALTA